MIFYFPKFKPLNFCHVYFNLNLIITKSKIQNRLCFPEPVNNQFRQRILGFRFIDSVNC